MKTDKDRKAYNDQVEKTTGEVMGKVVKIITSIDIKKSHFPFAVAEGVTIALFKICSQIHVLVTGDPTSFRKLLCALACTAEGSGDFEFSKSDKLLHSVLHVMAGAPQEAWDSVPDSLKAEVERCIQDAMTKQSEFSSLEDLPEFQWNSPQPPASEKPN